MIPRLGYTPYCGIRNVARVPDDDVRDAIDGPTTEQDRAKFREMTAAYVRKTGRNHYV